MKALNIPEPVKDALRRVHTHVSERRPYAEYAAMLDEVMTLPEAAHQDARRAVARERLDLLRLGTATNEEIDAVLVAHAAELADATLFERAMLVRAACLGRRDPSERHLPALLAEAEAADPDDRSRLAEILRHALALARGEVARRKTEDGPKLPDDLLDGIRYAHRLHSLGWPRPDVTAALDAVESSSSAAEYAEEIALHRRILAGQGQEEETADAP